MKAKPPPTVTTPSSSASGPHTPAKADSHYDAGGIKTICILKAKLTPEQYEGFLLGNIIKYSSRINHKGQFDSDARKIGVYTKMLEENRA
ncbi:uncharacterized protein DUF3310 [Sinobacterium caligoides]|uniref:Uncharacterized protein DUF3310 n=1 Tax=Sinobacterium caligoides TaxID=933926 RepID=A0A3N2E0T1_9GAMM|nr:DUF3310 domain-containing protein [Sinobacterium caligoides]ROS05731.1 uncharacterized protein DUF3310 [Sinobacterium caligoides]